MRSTTRRVGAVAHDVGGSSACTGPSESTAAGKFTVAPSGARTRTMSANDVADGDGVAIDVGARLHRDRRAAGRRAGTTASARRDARTRASSASPARATHVTRRRRARLARAEEPDQRLDDAAVGAHRDLVDREPAQQTPARGDLLVHRLGELRAHRRIARVDVERLARLGIDEAREPDVGQRAARSDRRPSPRRRRAAARAA